MTNRELCEEIKAIRDLAERLADKMDELNLRLGPTACLPLGGGKPSGQALGDYQRLPRWITSGRRDDEDEGSD